MQRLCVIHIVGQGHRDHDRDQRQRLVNMVATMGETSRLAAVALVFAATGAVAFPQRKNTYLVLLLIC